MRRLMITLSVVCGLAFFATLWWGSWLLRGGPEGPHGWAFTPVFVQAVAFMVGAFALAVNVSKGK